LKNFYWLIQGDCFKVLPKLGLRKVDLVILDPPYLVTDIPDKVRDEAVDALNGLSNSEWVSLFSEISEIVKENSVLAVFGHLPTFLKIHRFIEMHGFKYVTDLVWVKPQPVNFFQAKSKPLSQHETIAIWKKGKFRYNYEEAKVNGDPYIDRRKQKESRSSLYQNMKKRDIINVGYRFMSDVLFAPSKPHLAFSERTEHPTQKPEALIGKLVRAFSFRGDVVLDPFLGSGTTMKVCQDLGRSCIGIEIKPEYCEIVKKRCFGRKFLDREVEYIFNIYPNLD
jgi:DNA modification methylase